MSFDFCCFLRTDGRNSMFYTAFCVWEMPPLFSLTTNALNAYWCSKFINYIETNFALYVFKMNSLLHNIAQWTSSFLHFEPMVGCSLSFSESICNIDKKQQHQQQQKQSQQFYEKKKRILTAEFSYRCFFSSVVVVSVWANPMFISQIKYHRM